MKNFPSYLRAPLIFFCGAGLLEYFIDSGNLPAFLKYPAVFAVLVLLIIAIAIFETTLGTLERLKANDEDVLAPKVQEKSTSWLSGFTKAHEIESEEEIVLNHNYDGIKELDNVLPPWWVYLFYTTIVFAIVYLVRFEVLNDYTQVEEYQTEVVEAKEAFEKWKLTAKDYVDVSSVTELKGDADVAAGKKIFLQNCAVCHKADGGGSIGPNLTDDKWILGGGVKNIFTTISKGGRPDKGMEAWAKKGLKAQQIQQVSSFILTLQGTNPEGAKAPEGEVWKSEE